MPYHIFGEEQRVAKVEKVLSKRQPDLTIIIENIADPHNLSAVLRSCDAVGVMEICAIYPGEQKFPELGARSSASARKWVDLKLFDSIESCYEYVRTKGMKIFTTHMAKDAVSLYELNLSQPVALVFGNEHSGVTDKAVELADGNFLIPQVGMIQSLNISVACAVTLYEAFRQRSISGLYENSRFSENEFVQKATNWLSRKQNTQAPTII